MGDIISRQCGYCIECGKIGNWNEAEFIYKGNGLCGEHFMESIPKAKKVKK